MFIPKLPIMPPMVTGDPEHDRLERLRWKADIHRRAQSERRGFIAAVVASAVVIGSVVGLASVFPTERAAPVFSHGQIVTMKIDGRQGMVTGILCASSCSYYVRFPESLGTYATVFVSDYELEGK